MNYAMARDYLCNFIYTVDTPGPTTVTTRVPSHLMFKNRNTVNYAMAWGGLNSSISTSSVHVSLPGPTSVSTAVTTPARSALHVWYVPCGILPYAAIETRMEMLHKYIDPCNTPYGCAHANVVSINIVCRRKERSIRNGGVHTGTLSNPEQ